MNLFIMRGFGFVMGLMTVVAAVLLGIVRREPSEA